MDFNKMKELATRVYNNKMIEKKDETGKTILSDEEAIKALCNKVFTSNGEVRNMEELRSFNALIVEVADKQAEAQIKPILDAISDYSKVGRYDSKKYVLEKQARISMALSATASGVDFVRVSPYRKEIPARPENHQFGVYYNIDRMISDPVNEFRNAVNYVQEYKVKYLFKKIMEATRKAVKAVQIPAKQVWEGTGIKLTDFRTIENNLLRYGRVTPVLIADINLIDALALAQGSAEVGEVKNVFLSDELKNTLLRDVNIDKVSRTTCIATDNPFIDDKNSKVDLPVNEGIMLAGGKKSPFKITEFGALRTAQDMPSIENETVYMKIDYKLDVTLLTGQAMGYICDKAIIL
ncbi:hypothetical protein [Clostridium haemolyticum]|uniref:Phage virion protein n=1 Tax=Clostridium haemolyticum NCTC 9693 TaxID=1443114 RepID=A0ABR4TB64_CLOHA|nr:hypothetical protein [Clostridium haemolyticum]KEI14162.1 phage virion protein [Clostridium haemolyticum NCTC 9693]